MKHYRRSSSLILMGVLLFLLAAAANFGTMVTGGPAGIAGFIFSLLFACALVALPLLAKGGKGVLKFSMGGTGLLAVASIIGLLKYSDKIASDYVIPIIVIPLTSLYGLTYVIPFRLLYYTLIVFSLFCSAMAAFLLFKARQANDDSKEI